ncbi:UNVERIFIED_CONTAM: hypothetical protein Slati_0348400 [Sesamum latifolium]|uniref:Uncharacterized protein n=1 Tax=Sesamum latifolium TaxID=2727402 RepID=A0AAW2YFK0_9LAMI
MSGVSLQSKTRVLETPGHLEYFLAILSFLASVLSIRDARTEMTKGVFESSWYEYE